jgi:hypothetical protein
MARTTAIRWSATPSCWRRRRAERGQALAATDLEASGAAPPAARGPQKHVEIQIVRDGAFHRHSVIHDPLAPPES